MRSANQPKQSNMDTLMTVNRSDSQDCQRQFVEKATRQLVDKLLLECLALAAIAREK
jgi:hypothetical protein